MKPNFGHGEFGNWYCVPELILPQDPLALRYDKRVVVYFQANIHAGEVEGKEATLMLARDILLDPELPYLDKVVLLVAPIFNADGNDKMSPDNRRGQVGPVKGKDVLDKLRGAQTYPVYKLYTPQSPAAAGVD